MVMRRTHAFFLAALAASLTLPLGYAAPKMRLTPKDVAELVLKQGPSASQVNDTYLVERFGPATALLPYDWKAQLEYGYEDDKTESIDRGLLSGSDIKSWITTVSLNKNFTTGTQLALTYGQRSMNADYTNIQGDTTKAMVPKAAQGEFGITIEQSLLKNAFGVGDRAVIRSAKKTFESAGIQRVDNLENVVLGALAQYWNSYVAEETFREALESRERSKKLVAQVRRKNSVGYANPGELAEVLADFEAQEQSVKTASTNYLAQLDTLLTNLNLPAGTQIEFAVSQDVPAVPKLPPVKPEELRTAQSANLQLDAAREALFAAQNRRYPDVNLVGKYASTGYDETTDGAFSRLSGNAHPRYYIGAKLAYSFGSDYQSEDIIHKRALRDLKETAVQLEKLNSLAALAQEERSVESTYAILQSAFRQKDFRERAVKELTRTYTQGRTDIKVLIDAINNQFETKVKLARALGDYQIALNKWAAIRDELIPSDKSNESGRK
jgi:outer membrane protein TolC